MFNFKERLAPVLREKKITFANLVFFLPVLLVALGNVCKKISQKEIEMFFIKKYILRVFPQKYKRKSTYQCCCLLNASLLQIKNVFLSIVRRSLDGGDDGESANYRVVEAKHIGKT